MPAFGDLIRKEFPLVNFEALRGLLLDKGGGYYDDLGARFVHSVLNNSIDARVIDYVRRDCLHLGLTRGNSVDLTELFANVEFRDGELVVKSSGVSALEELITLRFWLFKRIYWNSPNRALMAMLRHLFFALRERKGFEGRLRDIVLVSKEGELLRFLQQEAKAPGLKGIADLLVQPRPPRFSEFYQFNRTEDDANAQKVCDRVRSLGLQKLEEVRGELDAELVRKKVLVDGGVNVLIDIPKEIGRLKFGEDVNVVGFNGAKSPAVRFSSIIKGANEGVERDIQRVRVFVRPGGEVAGEEGKARGIVRDFLLARFA